MLGGAGIGLAKLMSEPKPYTPDPSYQSVDVMLPEKKKQEQVAKLAASQLTDALVKDAGVGSAGQSVVDWLHKLTYPYVPRGGGLGHFFGDQATTPWEVPAFYTLGAPLGAAAAYGGFKLTHDLVDNQRKRQLEDRLAKTKGDYARFVQENLANKTAADTTIEAELDELADLCEKKAQTGWGEGLANMMPDIGWHALNAYESAYYPYALLSALTAGKLSYDYFKKRSPQEVNEEALQRRAKERYGGTTPIYLEPSPGGSPV